MSVFYVEVLIGFRDLGSRDIEFEGLYELVEAFVVGPWESLRFHGVSAGLLESLMFLASFRFIDRWFRELR